MTRLPIHRSWLAAFVVVLLPRLAAACPACFAASDARVAHMYVLTALLLSALPFGVVLGIAWWCWRRQPAADEPT
ncbi:MAG: hypothetical protein SF182_17870 [Deltaproteobacteria bacterium]|nr:hypothetical protein [Deltaproteobacteria bacterium]